MSGGAGTAGEGGITAEGGGGTAEGAMALWGEAIPLVPLLDLLCKH